MKTKCFFILIFLSFQSLPSQVYHGGFEDIFFDRFAGAKNEAMGKILSVGSATYFTSLANPAINTGSKEISAYYSYSSHYYLDDDFSFKYMGATINLGDIGAFGLSMSDFNWGNVYTSNPISPEGISKYNAAEKLYSLSYANSFGSFLKFGIEANLYIDDRYSKKTFKSTFFNIGIGKDFVISDGNEIKDNLSAGINAINIFGQGVEYSYDDFFITPYFSSVSHEYFPTIFRVGIGNEMSYYNNEIYSGSHFIRLSTSIEYEDVLNYKYRTTYKFGAELSLLNIIAVRCGYFSSSLNNINNTKENLDNFTYGAGLNLDFRELTKNIPLALTIDYVSLEQPSYVNNISNWENFNTIQARIRYFY